MTRIHRGFAALVAGVVAGGCLVFTPAAASATGTGAASAGLDRFYRQHLAWHQCQQGPQDTDGQFLDQSGAQCAEATVPLDYARPAGRTITVALSRLKATDTAHRIGALLMNLGGPSLPVLATTPFVQQAMGPTGTRFDLIGMDPRFGGRSTTLDCGWPDSWIPRSAGTDRHSFASTVTVARDLARRCADRYGDVLPYATTVNTARDMDVVRGALGEAQLSYLGFNYGTYLGAVYMQMFPHRAGRMVLDSAVDPVHPGPLGTMRGLGPAREAALADWAGWAARHDAQFHLGGTAAEVLARIGHVYDVSARHPIQVGPFSIDDTIVPGLLVFSLSDDTSDSNADLATTVQILDRAADGFPVDPTPTLAGNIASLLTGAISSLRSAQAATLCADTAVPRDPQWYWRDIQTHRADAPLFGPLTRAISPCAFWPTGFTRPDVRIHNDTPALIVNADGDINSNYEGAQAMHRALTGSRFITLADTRTIGVYPLRGAACVNDAVNAYLDTGTLPRRDLTCAGQPVP